MYDEKRRIGELSAARDEGIAEGLVQGHAEGLAQGQAQGHAEAQAEIARKMLESGMSVEQIARFTGLTPEEIAAWQK